MEQISWEYVQKLQRKINNLKHELERCKQFIEEYINGKNRQEWRKEYHTDDPIPW